VSGEAEQELALSSKQACDTQALGQTSTGFVLCKIVVEATNSSKTGKDREKKEEKKKGKGRQAASYLAIES
jgi:hypothetical protein